MFARRVVAAATTRVVSTQQPVVATAMVAAPARFSHTHFKEVPRRGEAAPRADPPPVAKRKLYDFQKKIRQLKAIQKQHYYETGEWKPIPWQDAPTGSTPRHEPPEPTNILTPLPGPYPSYVRVNHPQASDATNRSPLLPTGVEASLAANYVEQVVAMRAEERGEVAPPAGADEAEVKRLADVHEHKKGVLAKQIEEWRTPGDKFAICVIQGKQFKVMEHDQVMVMGLQNKVDIGQKLTLDHVLLVGARDYTLVGLPKVDGAYCKAVVEEHNRTAKTNILKKKRRKGYRRFMTHRDKYTILRITEVTAPATAPPHTTDFCSSIAQLPLNSSALDSLKQQAQQHTTATA